MRLWRRSLPLSPPFATKSLSSSSTNPLLPIESTSGSGSSESGPFKDPNLSQSKLIGTLLSSRSDIFAALNYFKLVKKEQILNDLNQLIEPFCVLIHILAGYEGEFDSGRRFLCEFVSSHQWPNPRILVDCLIQSGKRFGFEVDSRVFNFLLSVYVRAGRIEDAVCYVNSMIENGVDLWVLNVNSVFNLLIKKNMIKQSKELYDSMVLRGISRDSATIRLMICACLKDGKAHEAERYFKEARNSGVELDAKAYSFAVGAVCRKPDSNVALELLKETKEKGWVPSEGTFTNVILACVKQGKLAEALTVKDEMVSCGKKMNLVVATCLMKGYCAFGDLDRALDLFSKIVEDGVRPNKVTFSVLIEGCVRNGNLEKAHELYDQMVEMGFQPTGYNVNLLIKGFIEAQLWDEAYEHFNKAAESGIANAHSYNVLILSLCKDGKVDEARELLDRMVNSGIKPNVVSYNNLILGYSKKGCIDMADHVCTEMLEKGFKPNVVTFTILIDGYLKKGEVERAFEKFDEMVDLGIARTEFTYNTIINRLSKLGRTSQAKETLKKFMEEDGFIPTCMTYNSIIDGFIKEGVFDEAFSVYTEMRERGISPNVITYTTLIDGFCKSKNIDLALKMKNEMISQGLHLDVTAYGALIDGCCKKGDMETGSGLFSELLEVGLTPNQFIYNSMISGYRNLNNMEAALSLHKTMVEQAIPCDLETYTTLIDGLLREGRLRVASDFYSEMLAKGIMPDIITYTVLVNGLCNRRQLENAREILREMQEKGLSPNVLIYNALIAGYFKEGNLKEAFRLHDEMLERGLQPDKMTFDFILKGGSRPREAAKAPWL